MLMRSTTPWRRSPPTLSRHVLHAAFLLAAVLLVAAPTLAASGTMIHDTTVYQIDELGTDQVDFGVLVELDSSGSLTTATRSGDTWLAVIDPVITAPQSLVRFDAATGDELDSLFITLPADTGAVTTIGTGPNGLLWVLSRNIPADETVLGQLDPATGLVTRIAAIPEFLAGFTVVGGEVYTFVEAFSPDDEGQLARLELATGALDIVGDLPGTNCSQGGDLDIDDGGVVHLGVAFDTCGIVLPNFETRVVSFRANSDGTFTQVGIARPALLFEPAALEVTGSVFVVDVPTLDTAGLAALIGLLGLGGVVWIRRHGLSH